MVAAPVAIRLSRPLASPLVFQNRSLGTARAASLFPRPMKTAILSHSLHGRLFLASEFRHRSAIEPLARIVHGANIDRNFNAFHSSSSTTDVLATVDALGRPHVSQQKEAPGSTTYDSVETDFDSLGRPDRTTVPYPGSSGQTSSSAPSTTTIYDALGRPTSVTDSGSGYRDYTYSQNDTYESAGPAPSGENTKRKQFEYDALRRLTSICEITSATGSGTCGQTSSPPDTGRNIPMTSTTISPPLRRTPSRLAHRLAATSMTTLAG